MQRLVARIEKLSIKAFGRGDSFWGLDAEGQLVCGGTEEQARQMFNNLKHVLKAGGATLQSVVRITIILADMQDFKIVNQVYTEFFSKSTGAARAIYQVCKLLFDASVQAEAVALSGEVTVKEAGPCPCARK